MCVIKIKIVCAAGAEGVLRARVRGLGAGVGAAARQGRGLRAARRAARVQLHLHAGAALRAGRARLPRPGARHRAHAADRQVRTRSEPRPNATERRLRWVQTVTPTDANRLLERVNYEMKYYQDIKLLKY